MLKTFSVMLVAVTAATAGDILLARGMKEIGDLSAVKTTHLFQVFLQLITAPKLIFGTLLLTVFYFLWLAVLSWEDLSVALPLQALNFILVAFCSQWILHEPVTLQRWMGTALICAGVFVVARSGA